MTNSRPVRWLTTAVLVMSGGLVLSTVGQTEDENRIVESIYGSKAKEPWKLQYKAGTVARGVVVNETKQALYLDGAPCNGKAIYQFTEPFEKTPTGEKVTCSGKQLTEFQVKQGAR